MVEFCKIKGCATGNLEAVMANNRIVALIAYTPYAREHKLVNIQGRCDALYLVIAIGSSNSVRTFNRRSEAKAYCRNYYNE